MEYKKYYAIIEALLFASGEPLALGIIAQTLSIDKTATRNIIDEMINEYKSSSRGIMIIELGETYQMCTKAEHENYIKTALAIKKNTPLSQAAMETLAIAAYNQPVTKSFIEQVRGVDSSSIVNSLVEKGLLEEAYRLDVPGRPIAYKTTNNFLRAFKLSSIDALPPIPDDSGQVTLEEVVGNNKD